MFTKKIITHDDGLDGCGMTIWESTDPKAQTLTEQEIIRIIRSPYRYDGPGQFFRNHPQVYFLDDRVRVIQDWGRDI